MRRLRGGTKIEMGRLPYSTFRLSDSFLSSYTRTAPPFGFNGLGSLVYATRYSRLLPGQSMQRERWIDTVERVVNGTYRMEQRWAESQCLGWDIGSAQASAQVMFDKIFRMKFLPPGRGLWAMGTAITEDRNLHAALNNCAFVSTARVRGEDPTEPYIFLMDAAMLGVGVGFDTLGAGQPLFVPGDAVPGVSWVIEDSREGWVASVKAQLKGFFTGSPRQKFDYSLIRPRGTPIKCFGGRAAGPEVLRQLHESIDAVLGPCSGRQLTVTALCDVMNLIGRAVVSGDVRQTAEIAFGDPSCPEYTALKDYRINPQRAAWGWTSNNSVFAELGQSYEGLAARVAHNGEPGFAWLENMRAYGRLREDEKLWKDARAAGGNPCLEQTLESYEMCCLVETFPAASESLEEFKDTLRYAYRYAKVVTLGKTHWPASNRIMARNRRIGASISGIAQFIAKRGTGALVQWCNEGYSVVQETDSVLSETFAVPRSIKTTCVKPSGTVSLLTGATPGMHFPESRYYIRRVRLANDHPTVNALREAGYVVEKALEDPDRKVVVEIPVDVGEGVRTLDEVSMWEQLGLAALLQRHWADNQVSCTVTFDPLREGPQLSSALNLFQYQLKGVSFLPKSPLAEYPQLPYQAISKADYAQAVGKLKGLSFESMAGGMPLGDSEALESPDKFCDAASCETLQQSPTPQ